MKSTPKSKPKSQYEKDFERKEKQRKNTTEYRKFTLDLFKKNMISTKTLIETFKMAKDDDINFVIGNFEKSIKREEKVLADKLEALRW